MLLPFIVNDIIIPAIEGAIKLIVRMVLSGWFWALLAVGAVAVVVLHVTTGQSFSDIFNIDNATNLWGLVGGDSSDGSNPADNDLYQGGATPHDAKK